MHTLICRLIYISEREKYENRDEEKKEGGKEVET